MCWAGSSDQGQLVRYFDDNLTIIRPQIGAVEKRMERWEQISQVIVPGFDDLL